jgi:5-methylcytosine-specific restriction endonuclease McrA
MSQVKITHADGRVERFVSSRAFKQARAGDTWAVEWNAYITSAAWRKRRATHLRKFPRCRGCNAAATVVHHRSYETLGREKERHLVSLCQRCHLFVHRTARRVDGDDKLFSATNSAIGTLRQRHGLTKKRGKPLRHPTFPL